MSLREYQQECIDVTLENIKKGQYKQLVSLPTGSGKTVVMAHLIPLIPSPTKKATKVFVIAHRIELLKQAKEQIQRYNPDLNVQIEQANNVADPKTADVVIFSISGLRGDISKCKRINKFDPADFKAIIVDEAHHGVAPTYMKAYNYFGALEKKSKMLIWGCTATVVRSDKKSLEPVFGPVSYHLGFKETIQKEFLSDMRITTVSGIDPKDFDVLNQSVVWYWKKHAYEKGRKSTLAFAKNIEQTEKLCEEFIENGIDARFVTSHTDKNERAEIIADFKTGKCPVLVNCGIFTEGTDLPRIDTIIMARSTDSESLFQQMLGRGSRLHEGKSDCLVFDFVGNFSKLFGDVIETQNRLEENATKAEKVIVTKEVPEKPEAPVVSEVNFDEYVSTTANHYHSLQDYINRRDGEESIDRIAIRKYIKSLVSTKSHFKPLIATKVV